MAMIPQFNAQTVEPMGEAKKVLPTGDYKMAITSSEMKPTATGGQYLQLNLTVMAGEHTGAQVTDRLNLVNKNPQTVSIAQRILSAICHSVGVLQISDSQQLHNKPMLVRVEAVENNYVDKDGNQRNGFKNEIRGYKTATGSTPVAQAPAQAAPITPTYAPAQEPQGGWNRGGQNPFGAATVAADQIPF
jgi:hypothetical protein